MSLLEPSEEFAEEIHQRLLAKDPRAPSELAVNYLEILVERLRRATNLSGITDENLLYDAAIDAILNYAEKPSRFDPNKSKLMTYLVMSAKGDLKNLLAKEKRRKKSESKVVEQITLSLKYSLENDNLLSTDNDSSLGLMKQVLEEFSDPCDRQLLDLILDGERKTSAYAEILGIQDYNEIEQRRIVKRHKDRIKARLKRLGVHKNG